MIFKADVEEENKRLANLNFITNFGDWLSYFGFMYYFFEASNSVHFASSVIFIKSATILLANIIFPYLLNRFTLRSLVLYPQCFCGVIGFGIIAFIDILDSKSIWFVMGLTVFQSLFREIFSSAKDTYSKYLRENKSHLDFQSQILSGQFRSQFLGPLFVLFTIKHISLRTFVTIDTVTFFVSAWMARGLSSNRLVSEDSHSIWAPLKYLFQKPKLFRVQIGRTIIFTVASSIENLAGVGLLRFKYGLHVVDDAWTYLANGFGAYYSTTYLKNKFNTILKHNLGLTAFISMSFMGIVRIVFSTANYFPAIVILFLFCGIAMGFHALSTQTLRSRFTTKKEFPEVASLENMLGEKIALIIQVIFGVLFSKNIVTYQDAMFYAGLFSILGSLIYLGTDVE